MTVKQQHAATLAIGPEFQVLMQFELTKLNTQDAERFERQTIVAALFRLCDPLRTMDNIQVGDVVQLKSGGPTMTINEVSGNGSLFCQWFDRDGALKTGTFQLQQLKKAEPRAPSDEGGGPVVRQR